MTREALTPLHRLSSPRTYLVRVLDSQILSDLLFCSRHCSLLTAGVGNCRSSRSTVHLSINISQPWPYMMKVEDSVYCWSTSVTTYNVLAKSLLEAWVLLQLLQGSHLAFKNAGTPHGTFFHPDTSPKFNVDTVRIKNDR